MHQRSQFTFNPARALPTAFRSLAWLAVFLLSLLSGCSLDGPGETGGAEISVLRQALSAEDVVSVTVTVTGTGISPDIVVELTESGDSFVGEILDIPAGDARVFTAEAFDSEGTLIYEGQSPPIAIWGGWTARVTILLQQIGEPDVFENTVPHFVSFVANKTTVDPGDPVQIAVLAEDADGDPLVYDWTVEAGALDDPSSPNIVWIAPDSPGGYELTVTATDPHQTTAELSFVFPVAWSKGGASVTAEFNTWPVVEFITASPTMVQDGDSASLTVQASDSEGDTLSYDWSVECGDSSLIQDGGETATLDVTTVSSGAECIVSVEVSDGRGGVGTGQLTLNTADDPEFTLGRVDGHVLAGDFLVASESDIEAFVGVDAIDGDLEIALSGVGIDLSPFEELTTVSGNLRVVAPDLNLYLPALDVVEGDFDIVDVNYLTLPSLKRVGHALRIIQTMSWDLNGLNALREVGSIYVFDNRALVDIAGLSGVESLSGDLILEFNTELVYPGLPGLQFIGGSLKLFYNRITTLAGFGQLQYVGNDVEIASNPTLERVNDLLSWPEDTIAGTLKIYGNDQLPQCEVDQVETHFLAVCTDCSANYEAGVCP